MVARIRDVLRFLGVLVTAVASRRPVRPQGDEATRSLPDDELVADAKVRWNHAITIRARPADIWPWLVQMGYRRAGWYSYDGLDNGGVKSAERIVAEFQQIQVGDIFPMSPTEDDTFVVRVVEPERALVLGDAAGGMAWSSCSSRSTRTAPGSGPPTTTRPSACSSSSSGIRPTSPWNDANSSTSSNA
jgi:hypothetical protein